MVNEALEYKDKHDLSVIPVGNDKKPLIKWEEYQKRHATEEEIHSWWKKWPDANIGIVTGVISGIAVVDIDTNEGRDAIEQYIPSTLVTPTVRTPGGGQHKYFRLDDSTLTNNTRVIEGCDLRANGGYAVSPPSRNGTGENYEWEIGLDVLFAPLPQDYIEAVTQASQSNIYINKKYIRSNVDTLALAGGIFSEEGRRDNDLFHIANCLIKGGADKNESMQVLEILANNCNPPFPEKELRYKIQSAFKRSDKRDRSLAREVRDFVLSTSGYFMSTDVHNCLHLSTRREKQNVHMSLKRLCEEGLIERYGNRSGCYRLIDKTVNEIDFLNAPTESVNIKLPFQIEQYVKTLPKNILVVSGIPNSGKSAFLLNTVEMNMDKHDIYYFSSEMGPIEMRDRLSKFDRSLDSWRFKARERSSNFADVIRPDDINIIDFLEIYDDFWKIGGMIRDIYNRLNKGIAIIAIQKDPQKEYGTGAIRSLEKARLYLVMEYNKIKIIKAKNWVYQKVNPNGLELHYKLVQGCNFIIEKNWRNAKANID